jgi:rRNA maturation RNase YbeY
LRRVTRVLLRELLQKQSFELGLHVVDRAEITRLNETFLQHEGPTDVITFDYHEPDASTMLAGDIFVCIEEACGQARRFRTTWQSEFVRYIVHGVLHLSGYDDRRVADRRRMKHAEDRLLRELAKRFRFEELTPKTARPQTKTRRNSAPREPKRSGHFPDQTRARPRASGQRCGQFPAANTKPFRKTTQPLAPAIQPGLDRLYNLYPGYPIGAGEIELGFGPLAERLASHERVVIDGMGGVMWGDFRERLQRALVLCGVKFEWLDVREALKPATEIERLIEPFLGGDDPLFGSRNRRSFRDFFIPEKLQSLPVRFAGSRRVIAYGTGAGLVLSPGGTPAPVIYLDVPKNEIQFRARAGSITNLGAAQSEDPKRMYKRFYFVDWPALRKHAAELVPHIDWMVDTQRPEEPTFMSGAALRKGLAKAARTWCRVRPWFEPGPWGGQWMKQRFRGLEGEAPNLAWSFELISPENGLAFESSGRLLEVSFDFLMAQERTAVLGDFAERFGYEFPIRFDYLDTFGGGNLSVQCHPRPEYAWRNFGERFTQDETYYLTDCAPDARVFLGFQPGVSPLKFERALRTSFREAKRLDVENFVQTHPSRKHGLYLISNGTIHCSGVNNLVLEISATPYIFTFKMYDWLRLDLDGRPRPLNIERAMDNLYFERQGERVVRELIAQPRLLACGPDWQWLHLPTHAEHLYDVHRFDFSGQIEAHADGSPHVLNVVEGGPVMLETAGARPQQFAFAETFIVPAAAGSYRLRSQTGQPVKVVKAFLKPEARALPGYLQ